MDYLEKARSVIQNEIEGLRQVRDELGASFEKLVGLCLETLGQDAKIVLTGVGKSGHVGHKIAATLASTGSRAVFLHPVEAMHGDLGILGGKDLLLALSYSGETEELLQLLPSAKRFKIPVVAVSSDPESSLAKFSDLFVQLSVPAEACPFNLAPTTSTTAMLAFGDALAIVLMEAQMAAQKFSKDHYSKLHPAGAIGRTVTLCVRDIMRAKDRTPIVGPETTVHDALLEMTKFRSGSVLIAAKDGQLLGIFTDGDFRRNIQNKGLEVMNSPIREVMTAKPITLGDSEMAIAALKLFEERKIDDIPVVDQDGNAIGLIDIQDLPKFKLM